MDPLEDRVRRTLSDDRWRLPADDHDMLGRVHKGATRRRRRRTALNVTAAVTALAAGAGAVGLFTMNRPGDFHLADKGATTSAEVPTSSKAQPPESTPTESAAPRIQRTPERRSVPPTGPSPDPRPTTSLSVQPVPAGFAAVSMTAANPNTFWVLGGDTDAGDSALVARTRDSGTNFEVVGKLDAGVARGDNQRRPDTVGEIRFVDGSNGWAYGNGLWATHDGGVTWERVQQIPGEVERLETAAGQAYAVVKEQSGRRSLWLSPARKDAWDRASVELLDPDGLAAARGLVAVTDRSADKTYAMVSSDNGATFEQRETPCTPDLEAGDLSATRDSLWLTCATGTAASVQVSTNQGRTWSPVKSGEALGNSTPLGAKSPDTAIAAAPSEVVLLDRKGSARRAPVAGLDSPRYTGFTEPDVGYVLDNDGDLFRTKDGGANWRKLDVD